MTEKYNIPEPNSLDSMEGLGQEGQSPSESYSSPEELESELKVKLLLVSSGSSFSRPIRYCEKLGRNKEATEIKHCNILFQGGALLEIAKLVIKSIEEAHIDVGYKFKDKRDFYYGEYSLGSVIGHEIAYAIHGEKDQPYAQIEALFEKIRDEYDWEAPPEKILEMCKYIVDELEELISGRDVVSEYFLILDSFNVSKEEMVKYNIRNRILGKVPRRIQQLIDNLEEKSSETQLEKDIVEIFHIKSWIKLPFTNFLELMKRLDSLLNDYINLNNVDKEGGVAVINYKLSQFLYRKDIHALVKEDWSEPQI